MRGSSLVRRVVLDRLDFDSSRLIIPKDADNALPSLSALYSGNQRVHYVQRLSPSTDVLVVIKRVFLATSEELCEPALNCHIRTDLGSGSIPMQSKVVASASPSDCDPCTKLHLVSCPFLWKWIHTEWKI